MLKAWLECEAEGQGADIGYRGIRARDVVGLECDWGGRHVWKVLTFHTG